MVADTPFLKAAQLKERFAVYGTFYQLVIEGEEHSCRSLLELVSHHIPASQVKDHPPDLWVIMMNPGSSHPWPVSYAPPRVERVNQILSHLQWLPTRPDNTQYQIMRVMAVRGYQHARVMNLSDLREPKSNLLMEKIAHLAGKPHGGVHSIFCGERLPELQAVMPPESAPVLVGWGRHAALLPLARQCLQRLQGRRLVGVAVGEGLYAHPSPMLQRLKDQWVVDLLAQLSDLPS
ncbi:MAG: hypothetical protein HQL55_14040 [Magnetococcales bacterium]|nr:hypothetical protein [Magnetococcales bacterium]